MHSIDEPHGELDGTRALVHAMWGSVADQWDEHAAYVEARGAGLADRMLDALDLHHGDSVLELAAGPGNAGLAAAQRVGPAGRVVLSDVAPEMVAAARRRAEARGLLNIEAEVLDLESIDREDASFDAVLCREGLMFALEPDRALREVHRVLRPGGRVAAAVWGPRSDNPWLALVFDAVATETGLTVPPPGIPGPFSLEDADHLATLFSDAGFDEVRVERIPMPMVAASFEEWWTRTLALAGPLARIVAQLPEPTQTAIADRLRAATSTHPGSGIDLPGLTLLATARRP